MKAHVIRAFVWKLHQWLGVVSCLGLVLWAGTGLLHPIMSRTQPVPAQRMAPAQRVDLHAAMPLADVLRQQGIARITQAELASIDGQSYYRVQLPGLGAARYLGTSDGRILPDGDQRYAAQLARHYTALADTPIRQIRLITQFDADYLPVNKLLPVWRVDFARADGLRAFIDTSQARLAALTDARQTTLMHLFLLGHDWAFLDALPTLQHSLMFGLLACLLFTALSGLYFYARLSRTALQRLQNKPITRWHRRLGIIVCGMLLMAVGSGSYHLLHGINRPQQTNTPTPTFSAAEMTAHSWMGVSGQALAQLGLARLQGQLVWLVRPAPAGADTPSGPTSQVAHLAHLAHLAKMSDSMGTSSNEHAEHEGHGAMNMTGGMQMGGGSTPGALETMVLDEHGMTIAHGEEQIAQALALQKLGEQPTPPIVSTQEITRFGGEYSFFNKRLPVWRVQFADAQQTRLYVEPATGALAARMDASDAREGWSFMTLHKWQFMLGGANVRDALLALFALGNLIVGGLGLWLFMRRRQRE